MYDALQKRVTTEGPFVIMFQNVSEVVFRKNVTGFKPGIIGDLCFYRTVKKA